MNELIGSEWLDMVKAFKSYYLEPSTKFAPIGENSFLTFFANKCQMQNRYLY